jgi:hypothetical protein
MELHFNFERLGVYRKSLDSIDKAYQRIKRFPTLREDRAEMAKMLNGLIKSVLG